MDMAASGGRCLEVKLSGPVIEFHKVLELRCQMALRDLQPFPPGAGAPPRAAAPRASFRLLLLLDRPKGIRSFESEGAVL